MPVAASMTSGGTWVSPASELRTRTSSAYITRAIRTEVVLVVPTSGASSESSASEGIVYRMPESARIGAVSGLIQ